MFANMQRIAVALLVVAAVSADLNDNYQHPTRIDGYVSDLYSATNHTFVGSFYYKDMGDWVRVHVDKPLHFTSKYPYVAITLHRTEYVSPTCKILGPAYFDSLLTDQYKRPLQIYAGKYTGSLDRFSALKTPRVSLSPDNEFSIVNATVIMYSASPEDLHLSPIACGKIRHFTTADDFLEGHNVITKEKPTDLPSASNRQISPALLTETEAVSDLYDAREGNFMGSIIYRTIGRNSLEVGVLDFQTEWSGSVIAVVYHSEDVLPECRPIGPAVSIRDELNVTRPVILFKDEIDIVRKTTYGNVVDYASVSPMSDFDIMDHVVVLYIYGNNYQSVLENASQPTSPNYAIGCGVIRSVDASEDNFLDWVPVGLKPIRMSETRKCMQLIRSVDERFRNLLLSYEEINNRTSGNTSISSN